MFCSVHLVLSKFTWVGLVAQASHYIQMLAFYNSGKAISGCLSSAFNKNEFEIKAQTDFINVDEFIIKPMLVQLQPKLWKEK